MSKLRGWDPMRTNQPANPLSPMAKAHFETDGRRHHYTYRNPVRSTAVTAFGNRLYDGICLEFEDGSMHLSLKRKDRSAVRDWRHFQAIKNEVAGPEREALEIYPPESELVDAANEYHLWVLPEGKTCPFGLAEHAVLPEHDAMDYAAYREKLALPGARQRGWEPGIPTGLGQADA